MFSHVMIGSNDIARSKKFYDALFTALEVYLNGGIAYAINRARRALRFDHS